MHARARMLMHLTTTPIIHACSAPRSHTTTALHIGASRTSTSWQQPLTEQAIARGLAPLSPSVALGKFDALHQGHQALARACSANGMQPWMVSFSGMAQVLGWPQRLPLVAPQQRAAVLATWAPLCGGKVPEELYLPFADIRMLAPDAFVDLLATTLHVERVVVGENYRFGYKAAGDVNVLREECARHGVEVDIITLVQQGPSTSPAEEGVSSSRVRDALAAGRMDQVASMLGRPYCLIAVLTHDHVPETAGSAALRVPLERLCNQPPGPGTYRAVLRVGALSDDQAVALSEAVASDQPAEGVGEVHMAQQLVVVDVGVDGLVLHVDEEAMEEMERIGEGAGRGVQIELLLM